MQPFPPIGARRKRRLTPAVALLSLIGMGGFVGLLVASSRVPEGAVALRVLALIWLVGFGAMKLLLQFSRSE